MDNDTIMILKAIGSTEETTFKEFCSALEENCPQGSAEWSAMFSKLRKLEVQGMIKIFKTGSKTDGFILTEQGANSIRDLMDKDRGLFQ